MGCRSSVRTKESRYSVGTRYYARFVLARSQSVAWYTGSVLARSMLHAWLLGDGSAYGGFKIHSHISLCARIQALAGW